MKSTFLSEIGDLLYNTGQAMYQVIDLLVCTLFGSE